jgi:hypothetical protein
LAPSLPGKNYITASKARIKADKNVKDDEFGRLMQLVRSHLEKTGARIARANLNGIVVEIETNSDHQYEFWLNNWWSADTGAKTDAKVYSCVGVPAMEPSAYYHPKSNTSIFVNTEYYGQCKSWALGMAAAVLENQHNTLSIHGASATHGGKGVVIVAPTGTGKTTQSFKIFQDPEGKICGDDWVYVKFPDPIPTNPTRRLTARQPEKSLYMRTETQKDQEWIRSIFDESLTENVVTAKSECEFTDGQEMCKITKGVCVFNQGFNRCYYAFGNARALVKRESLLGPEKVVDEVPIDLVVLLRRDKHSPAELTLSSDEAIEVLKKGEYLVLPGAGPREKWGTTSYEPWYNPYLLQLNNEKQEFFFRTMFEVWKVPCIILNTGVATIDETYASITNALRM